MEATEVSIYGFIYKLMRSGMQQICEQKITRVRRKRDKFVCYFGVEVYVDVGVGARSSGVVI